MGSHISVAQTSDLSVGVMVTADALMLSWAALSESRIIFLSVFGLLGLTKNLKPIFSQTGLSSSSYYSVPKTINFNR